MMRTILVPAVIAGLLALSMCSQAHAYGAVHTGYTAVGPNGGAYHTGTTAAVGPYGGAAERTTSVGPYGATSTTRAYSPNMYGGYSGVGQTTSYYGGGDAVRNTTIYP
jgi:hypothetical protein